ncbi:hypothetical protein [uncultured Nostoc sp.]|nr:hypothetical protein [uncultured Nostoc sp.]
MQTAWKEARFNLYEGTVLLGVRWLQRKRVVADFAAGVLTLG